MISEQLKTRVIIGGKPPTTTVVTLAHIPDEILRKYASNKPLRRALVKKKQVKKH
jgi:hypothetical protein